MASHGAGTKRGAVFFSLAVLGSAAILWAQAPTGEIRLEVKDPSGAGMEASGRLQSVSSGVDRSFQTDPQGVYTFQSLPDLGRYRLEVTKSGFATPSVVMNVQSGTPLLTTVTTALARRLPR